MKTLFLKHPHFSTSRVYCIRFSGSFSPVMLMFNCGETYITNISIDDYI